MGQSVFTTVETDLQARLRELETDQARTERKIIAELDNCSRRHRNVRHKRSLRPERAEETPDSREGANVIAIARKKESP